MSIQPVPPSSAPTTAGQLAARATQNDQILANALADLEDRASDLESRSGTSVAEPRPGVIRITNPILGQVKDVLGLRPGDMLPAFIFEQLEIPDAVDRAAMQAILDQFQSGVSATDLTISAAITDPVSATRGALVPLIDTRANIYAPRVNVVRDPAAKNLPRWSVVSSDVAAALVADPDIGSAVEVQQDATPGTLYLAPEYDDGTTSFPHTSGGRCVMAVTVKAMTDCRVRLRASALGATTGFFLNSTDHDLTAGQIATVYAEAAIPAGATHVRPALYIYARGTTSSAPAGTRVRATGWTMELGSDTTAADFTQFDGDDTNARWTGGPDDSPSILDRSQVGKAIARGDVLTPTADLTLRVPTDYPTLQAAVDATRGRAAGATGATIELRIESGHAPASGISVADGDFSVYKVTSESAFVTVAPGFTGNFIRCERGTAPRLACLVDMDDRGAAGYYLLASVGLVLAGCGVRNAGDVGLYVGNASTCYASNCEFTGSNNRNTWVTRGSTLVAENANFSGNKGGDNAVYVSRASSAAIEYANVSNAFFNGIVSTRSTVDATGVDVSGAGSKGLYAERGGRMTAQSATVHGCGSYGAYAEQSSTMLLESATITDSGGTGIRAAKGGSVDATSATVTGSAGGVDLHVERGSFIGASLVSTTASSGTPALANTNVAAFNTPSNKGIIWA